MKKYFICFIALTLVLCMVIPLTSCVSDIPSDTTSASKNEKTEATETGSPDNDSSNKGEDNKTESEERSESQKSDAITDTTVAEETVTDETAHLSCVESVLSESEISESEVTESKAEESDTQETSTYIPSGLLPTGDGYTWKEAVKYLSRNWNPHTYQTKDEGYPLQYITSGLYTFVYNDEVIHKSTSGLAPFKGYVVLPEMAAEMPVDVTEQVKDEHPEFSIPDGATEGYAYKIALNPNASWENGDKINADTYIYSMAQLLDPALNNYRAYDHFWIANAEEYLRQGTAKYVDNGTADKYTILDLTKSEDGNYYTKDGNAIFIAVNYSIYWLGSSTLKQYVGAYGEEYFCIADWDKLVAATNGNGLAPLNDETYGWLLTTITGNPNWGETEGDAFNYFVEEIVYEDGYDFSNVGLYKTDEYEIVIVLDAPLEGFELINKLKDGWLVYEPYYEAGKAEIDGRLINKYGSSVATTMSYGPYKLTEYVKDMQMKLERNENWFGYSDGKHIYVDFKDGKTYDMYQSTSILCRIADPYTEKQMFLEGQLMSYKLDSNSLAELKNSDRAYFTPSDTVFFLILNGNLEAIQMREAHESFDTTNYDVETLTLESFRKALSLIYLKDEFASAVTPSRRGALGLIGSAYVYDKETGAKYRDSDDAKRVLCEYYGVDISGFESLDAAADSITGYDPEISKVLFEQAFEEAISAGYITDSDGDGISDQTIKLEYMSSATSDFIKLTLAFLNSELTKATEGTPFEGKIIICASAPFGTYWGSSINAGMFDVVMAGWNGNLLDPYSLTENYTDPKKQYDDKWFDSSAVSLTLNIEGNDITMSLREWSQALNGTTVEFGEGCEIYTYNFGDADAEVKLQILAAIEKEILKAYNYIPMLENGERYLLSRQISYVTEEYCPVMGYGGVAYTRYLYNDSEWAEYAYSFEENIPY